MKNGILIALASLALIGCAGETDKDSGDTGTDTTDTNTTNPTGTSHNSPIITDFYTFECGQNGAAADHVVIGVDTDYWTNGDGVFFWGDFANAAAGNWDEEHNLASFDPAADGTIDHLVRDLEADASVAGWTPDMNTVFSCASHLSGNENTMSGVATVYDLDGSFADCVAHGPDAQGLLDGDFSYINGPTNEAEWANCVVGR